MKNISLVVVIFSAILILCRLNFWAGQLYEQKKAREAKNFGLISLPVPAIKIQPSGSPTNWFPLIKITNCLSGGIITIEFDAKLASPDTN